MACVAGVAPVAWKSAGKTSPAGHAQTRSQDRSATDGENPSRVKVEVAKPTPHGLGRTTTQPGEVHVYEAAELYAKVSGYLAEQSVDIGDHVKRGQLLAVIDVPELKTEVEEAAASLERAKARFCRPRPGSIPAKRKSTQPARRSERPKPRCIEPWPSENSARRNTTGSGR